MPGGSAIIANIIRKKRQSHSGDGNKVDKDGQDSGSGDKIKVRVLKIFNFFK